MYIYEEYTNTYKYIYMFMGLHLGCLEARKSENSKSFYCFYSFCIVELKKLRGGTWK